jgi:hypothetical protein
MLPRPAFDYLFLGFLQIELQTIKGGQLLRRPGTAGALDRLEWYLDALVRLGLSTTLTAAWQLQNMRATLSLAVAPDSTLIDEQAAEIQTAALMLRETLKAEATNLTLYEVSGKRFDTRALLTNIPSLMRAGTYDELPTIAALDLHEAATCIAYE